MGTRYSIFPSISEDRIYYAEDFLARPSRDFLGGEGDGVSREVGGSLEVTEQSPAALGVEVALGVARANGWRFEVHTSAETVSLDTADGSDDRIDRIIIRVRTGSSNRDAILTKLTGTPAGSPSAPSLTRSGDTYEISLAQVLVGAGVTSVSNSEITDERGDESLCGWLRAQDSKRLNGKTESEIGMESGPRAFFQQTSAPTNWTKDTSVDNEALRVVSGTVGNGGANDFTTALNSARNTSTDGSHNHGGTNATTLTTSQMPAHDHTVQVRSDSTSGLAADTGLGVANGNSQTRDYMLNAGGGGSHSHSISSGGSHNHSLNLDVKYRDCIIATKD